MGCCSSTPARPETKVKGGSTKRGSTKVDPEQRYEVLKELGRNPRGATRLMRNKETGELVVIKTVERHSGDIIPLKLEREVLNHKRLDHPSVIRFRELFLTQSAVAIVLDYADGGTLAEHMALASRKSRLPEEEARQIFSQVVTGLEYCHKAGVFHRDLNLNTILLHGHSQVPTVKLSSFEYSKHVILDPPPETVRGNSCYLAPEMLGEYADKFQPENFVYGFPADVWCLGIVLYAMLVGQYPFVDPAQPKRKPGLEDHELLLTRAILDDVIQCRYTFPKDVRISKDCQDLISRILVADPQKRYTIEQIKAHPWLAEFGPTEGSQGGDGSLSKQSDAEIARAVSSAFMRRP